MPSRRKYVVWGIVLQALGLLVFTSSSGARDSASIGAGLTVAWLLLAAGVWLLLIGVIAIGVRIGVKDTEQEPEKKNPSSERLTLRR